MIFVKDHHLTSLVKLFKMDTYKEIAGCERVGNFTLRVIDLIELDRDNELKKEEKQMFSAIIVKRESKKMQSIEDCRKVYGQEALSYPRSSSKIKQIKPKFKVKIVEIVV